MTRLDPSPAGRGFALPPARRGVGGSRRAVWCAVSLVVMVALIVLLAAATAARAASATFAYTGAEQSFVVPDAITSVQVLAVGGHGGAGLPGGAGGRAAQVSGVLGVTPGETLYVEVGGDGGEGELFSLGGFNGGGEGAGGGGGASDVRSSPRALGLAPDSRLLVAGGGGGGGASGAASGGGGGGAGEAGAAGANQNNGGGAGMGGGGGAGGEGNCVSGSNGTEGSLSDGGAGGRCLASLEDFPGGGGGGGLYGGGGGGGANTFAGGGGGGGSSLLPPGTGAQLAAPEAAPQVTITYPVTGPCPAGVRVDARWHYTVHGLPAGWRPTASARCEAGSVLLAGQAPAGGLLLAAGGQVKAGYDLKLLGASVPSAVTVSDAQVVFGVDCVFAGRLSAHTFTVAMPTETYTPAGHWVPSADPNSPLVYQGAASVPNLCGAGQPRLDGTATFSAVIGF